MAKKQKIIFVCLENACRSQIAEAFARKYGKDLLKVESGGTNPAEEIDPHVVKIMKEEGISLTGQYPKLIPQDITYDILVTMGCEVQCPFVPAKKRLTWDIEDPRGKSLSVYRKVKDKIKNAVKQLVKELIDETF
jgi:arsenate reductase